MGTRHKKKDWLTYVVIIIAISLAVFALYQPQESTREPTRSLAIDFEVTDIYGKVFRLSEQHGKVVVIEFMTTKCSYCAEENIHLASLAARYGEKVLILSVSVDPLTDTDEILRQYSAQHKASWVFARDTDYIAKKYDVKLTPTIVIIDQEGYTRYRYSGITTSSILIEAVEKLLS
jgi:protein SCO1/2